MDKLQFLVLIFIIRGVSRPPVLDCGTTFHPDYGGRSTPSDQLWKLIYLATEALSDSFEFIGAIEIRLSLYLCSVWRIGHKNDESHAPRDRQTLRPRYSASMLLIPARRSEMFATFVHSSQKTNEAHRRRIHTVVTTSYLQQQQPVLPCRWELRAVGCSAALAWCVRLLSNNNNNNKLICIAPIFAEIQQGVCFKLTVQKSYVIYLLMLSAVEGFNDDA